uniref:Phosphodiesterase n=1 Tax=Timema shepardi TaxID=629360 RepID=A0A7R9AUA9_TIMSH|nr:unnamed protein product [Timema shepardi]
MFLQYIFLKLNVSNSVTILQFMKKIQRVLYGTVRFTVVVVVFDCCANEHIGRGWGGRRYCQVEKALFISQCRLWCDGGRKFLFTQQQGSLTIVRRSSTKKSQQNNGGSVVPCPSSSSLADDDTLDAVDLATDNLPAVDTPDACDKAAIRLRCLLRQLQRGEISAELLQKNLHYAARVLEAVFIDETKQCWIYLLRESVKVAPKEASEYYQKRHRKDANHASPFCDAPPCRLFPRRSDSVKPQRCRDLDLVALTHTGSGGKSQGWKTLTSSTTLRPVVARLPATTQVGAPIRSLSRRGGCGRRCGPGGSDLMVALKFAQTGIQRSFVKIDSLCKEDKSRLADEDDELSEVQPDAVPPEVREWLASTFTRQLATTRRKNDEKPKFRSVAHAIRAGIFVDRIYRRVSNTALMQFPPEVVKVLKTLDDWSFDVFALSESATSQPVKYLGYDLLNRYGMIHKFKVRRVKLHTNSIVSKSPSRRRTRYTPLMLSAVDYGNHPVSGEIMVPPVTLETFLNKVEEGYCRHRNPYHNNLHAADVAQTVHYMLCQTGLMNWLTDLEIFATLVAAIIHDYEHTGTTNNFHVMSGTDTALLYNDRAVLENHHISASFRVMREEECNILQNLSREEFREFRSLVIDMVLATDMSFHFQQLKNMRNLLSLAEPSVDKSKALSLVLHCCDISHPAKRWDLHHRWTMQLLEEFFIQGDKERELGLPFSPLCDRNNTLVAESQIGFIEFIVEPSMGVCSDMLESILGPIHSSCKPQIGEGARDDGFAARVSGVVSVVGSARNEAENTYDESLRDSYHALVPSGATSSPERPGRFKIKKPWVGCLIENKTTWKDQAVKDAELRAQNQQQENEETDFTAPTEE